MKILGIIRDGGDQAIFIPDHCSAEFTIRSFSMKYKWELFHRFIKICENVASITGTRFEYEMIDLSYEDIRNNPVLEDTLAENFKVLGEELCPRLKEQGIGCTDMGNVTHALPASRPISGFDRDSGFIHRNLRKQQEVPMDTEPSRRQRRVWL